MTHDTFDILLAAYDELGQLHSGIATGGSATTLVDSGLTDADENKYKKGTLFIESADGASPEAEFAEVTAFDDSNGTLTVAAAALGAAPAAGDIYSVAPPTYTLDDVRHYLNRALRALGPVPDVDESLTTAAGTTEYTIPIAAKSDLRQVWLRTSSTSGDQRYVERFDWGEVPDADGAATTTLKFRQQPESGETIRLVFMNVHPKIWDHDDELSEYIALERIVIELAWRAARAEMRKSFSDDKFTMQLVNELAIERENMRRKYPIYQPRKPMRSLLTSTGGRHRKYGPFLP